MFKEWLVTVCFQKPTPETEDLAMTAWQHQQSIIESQRLVIERLQKEVDNYYGGKLEVMVDDELLEATYEQGDEGGTSGWCIDRVPAMEEKDREIEALKTKAQAFYDEMNKLQAESELDVNEIEQLQARVKELEKALKPFAQFYCSEVGTCACNNCIARDLLINQSQAKP